MAERNIWDAASDQFSRSYVPYEQQKEKERTLGIAEEERGYTEKKRGWEEEDRTRKGVIQGKADTAYDLGLTQAEEDRKFKVSQDKRITDKQTEDDASKVRRILQLRFVSGYYGDGRQPEHARHLINASGGMDGKKITSVDRYVDTENQSDPRYKGPLANVTFEDGSTQYMPIEDLNNLAFDSFTPEDVGYAYKNAQGIGYEAIIKRRKLHQFLKQNPQHITGTDKFGDPTTSAEVENAVIGTPMTPEDKRKEYELDYGMKEMVKKTHAKKKPSGKPFALEGGATGQVYQEPGGEFGMATLGGGEGTSRKGDTSKNLANVAKIEKMADSWLKSQEEPGNPGIILKSDGSPLTGPERAYVRQQKINELTQQYGGDGGGQESPGYQPTKEPSMETMHAPTGGMGNPNLGY